VIGMNKANIKSILEHFIKEVWTDGNINACDGFVADCYSIRHDPGDAWHQRTLSRAEFKERVRLSRAPFPDQRFELQELFAEDSAVAATWLWTGTHQGDIPGFPASGRQIRMSGATVYYFDDDRITGHWQITDRLGVFQQLRSAT
jgi:steroid delta-isomerase-like uncharacterized protein